MADQEQVSARRARGEGSIYVNRHGVVCYQVRVRGERKRYSTGKRGEPGRKAAEKLIAQKLAEAERGGFAPRADQLRLGDLEKLVNTKLEALGKDTVHTRASFRRLREHFGFRRAIDIPKGMDAYIDEQLKAGVGRGTIRRDVATVRRALNLAHRRGLIPYKLTVPTTEAAPPRQGFADEAAWARIAKALERRQHVRPLCQFLFLSGWRKGRALGLLWKEVDMDRAEIRLEEPGPENKGVPDVLPFAGTRLETIIRERWAATQARQREFGVVIPTVFWRPTRTGARPISDFRCAWDAACKAAGKPGLLIHDLRRSRARLWQEAGVRTTVAMLLGGWKRESTYNAYAVADRDDKSNALQKADAYAAALKSKAARTGAREERQAG